MPGAARVCELPGRALTFFIPHLQAHGFAPPFFFARHASTSSISMAGGVRHDAAGRLPPMHQTLADCSCSVLPFVTSEFQLYIK